MADPISGAMVKAVVQEPISQAYQQFNSMFFDFKSNIESLQNSSAIIEAVLCDVDSVEHHSQAEQVTVDNLRCQLDRLRDFFDEKESRAFHKQIMGGNRVIKEARLFFSSSNQLFVRFKDSRKIKDIRKQLDSITTDNTQFGSIVNRQPSSSRAQAMSIQTTTSYILNDAMVGRNEDKTAIIRMVHDDSVATETLSISAVTGIGGIGKTMLARHVYNDAMVKRSFEARFWVDVTQGFDVTKILERIASSSSIEHGSGSIEHDQESLIIGNETHSQCFDHFIQAISGKKFLLVLDNIWDQPDLRLKWLELRRLLEFGGHGGKVLITTRDKKVAGMMDSPAPYTLGDLTEGESRLLFQQTAFTQWQDPGVKKIGEEILKMCPKVPLVIRSVGGVLAGKSTIQEWLAFRDDQFTNFASYGRDIIGTLKLSYDQLDTNLKLCALFCSLFHKGFQFDSRTIICLWIGLGYVVPKYNNQSLEEAGEEYLISLRNCGFFYKSMSNLFGFTVVMQDVMHDLTTSLAGSRYKMADSNTHEFHKGVRHVSVVGKSRYPMTWEVPSSLFKIKHLESFIIATNDYSRYAIEVPNWSMCDKLISRFIFLKVLVLRRLPIENLPNSIGELLSLRYLDLSRTALVKLPNFITRLVNLLSLVLDGCSSLQEWPRDMSKLVKLRHLKIIRCDKLTHMPAGLGKLVDLRILNMFIVNEHQSSNSEFKVSEVGRLADLNGLNHITGAMYINVRKASRDIVADAKEANLNLKAKLTELIIYFHCSTEEDEMVLEGLRPHNNMRVLHIRNYGGNSLPNWMMDNQLHCWLPNLVEITIFDCKSIRHLCFLGRLPHLRLVFFHGLDKVEYIFNSDSVVDGELHHDSLFPSLESLYVLRLPSFKGWWETSPSSNQDPPQHPNDLVEWKPSFPKLKTLSVSNMEVAIAFGQSLLNGCTSLNTLRIQTSMMVCSSSDERQALVHLNSFFPNLQSLNISCVHDLVALPQLFQGLSSLEELFISTCQQFMEIPDWVDNLISLKTLHIKDCHKFESLPHQIGNISTLKSLTILRCSSLLEERWRKPTGECWPYIQHIPRVIITPFVSRN